MTEIHRLGLVASITLCLWAAISSPACPAEPQSAYGKIELLRDQWGVPHVFAETDAGAMYGLGYATAEDRGFQMYYSLRIIQGRLAEVVGDIAQTRRRDTAVLNDRKMRTFGFARAARERVAELDAESVALLEAYAHGVNDWFADHRDSLPSMFRQTGLQPEPWTPADCLLSWWHLAQFFATDGTRDLLAYRNQSQGDPRGRAVAQRSRAGARAGRFPLQPPDVEPVPPDESTAVVQRGDVSDAWLERARRFLSDHGFRLDDTSSGNDQSEPPKFSHAWVADGKYSGSGSAVLVSMPQTPVANPSLLYEFHFRGATFDARGVGVAGSPIILIGWTPRVAWGMTALGADQADLFRLTTDDEHPGQYQFDGQWRDITTTQEEIKIRDGQSQALVIRQTHLGPIVNEFAFATPRDPPVALKRIPMCDAGRDTIQGAVAMMRAGTVQEFVASLEGWRFPTANVLSGDKEGNIAYSTIGALPLRSPAAAQSGMAHDGSRGEFDWLTIIPQELVPHVINPQQGYLFSGNHRPIGSFYPIPLGISTGSMGDTVRSWRLRQLFESRPSMTAAELRDMFRDCVNPARRVLVRIGYQARDVNLAELSDETCRALDHLQPWYDGGSPMRLEVPGAALAMEINTQFRFINTDLAFIYGGGDSGLSHFLKTVNQRLDADPAAQITALERTYVDQLLGSAWNSAVEKYGRDPDRWAELALHQVTARTLSYYGSLDGFPSLDPEHDLPLPPLSCIDGATVFSQAAQAYVQWVPLARVDEARSLLPPGSAEAPENAMRTVNLDRWAHGELHPAPLARPAVERITVARRTLTPSADRVGKRVRGAE